MRLDTLFVIQHSHTDLGFTHDAPVVEELHGRFLTQALDLAERHGDAPAGERFAWTVETCWFLPAWIARAPARDVERLRALERAGLVEVCALPFHTTPLADLGDLHDGLATARALRADLGLTITSAMNCDVNGQNWPLVDALLDAGVTGYTTAINTHTGRAPRRPDLFRWRGPAGRVLPTFNGPPYGFAAKLGIAAGADPARLRDHGLPLLIGRLREVGWTLPAYFTQAIHPFGDNGPADADLHDFVRLWNREHAGRPAASLGGAALPRIHLGTPRAWWDFVAPHADSLPVRRGDWTDSWNYGALSRARELELHRETRARVRTAAVLLAGLGALPPADLAGEHAAGAAGGAPDAPAPGAPGGFAAGRRGVNAVPDPTPPGDAVRALDRARALHLRWQEHTWNADCAVEAPWCDDTFVQTAHKTALVAQARTLATQAQRDALAALAQRVACGSPGDVLVFNPLPFARTVSGLVPGGVSFPRGRADDPTSGRHTQDRKDDFPLLELPARPDNPWKQAPELWLRPVEVPACGWKVVPVADAYVDPFADAAEGDAAEVETAHWRAVFDTVRGGIVSLRPRGECHELVDTQAGRTLGRFVHERLDVPADDPWPRRHQFVMNWADPAFEVAPGWKAWPAQRRGPERVERHRVRRGPLGVVVVQTLAAPGVVGSVEQVTYFPAHAPWVEFTTRFVLGVDTHPQSVYVAFPFAVPSAQARFDLGPQAVRPGADQMPGVCNDFFTAQNWVDLAGPEWGVTLALPDNPLFQLGGFHWGRQAGEFPEDTPPHVFGWVTCNYWETNFAPVQPGRMTARYRLAWRAGAFDEAAAHRFGLEAAHRRPRLQHLGERSAVRRDLPAAGTFPALAWVRALPEAVQVVEARPASGGVEVVLHNASDAEVACVVGGERCVLAARATRTCGLRC